MLCVESNLLLRVVSKIDFLLSPKNVKIFIQPKYFVINLVTAATCVSFANYDS